MRPCSTSSPATRESSSGRLSARRTANITSIATSVSRVTENTRSRALGFSGLKPTIITSQQSSATALLQHRVPGIGTETLGEREKANRPVVAQPFQLRDELGHARGVLVVADTVKVVHVDPIGAQLLQ